MITNILGKAIVKKLPGLALKHMRPLKWSSLTLPLQPIWFSTNKISEEELAQLKKKGQQFYSTQVEDVIELTSLESFNTIVKSIEVPFLANFYAEWNIACKTMTPRLQQKIRKSSGKVKLLNINIDKFGPIVNVFQVKSVPTVFLVYKGKVVDGFNEEISNEMLDKFLQTIDRVTKFDKTEQQSIKALEQAQVAIREGNYEAAQKFLTSMKTLNVKQELVFVRNIFLAFIYGQMGKVSHLKSIVQIMQKNEQFYITKPEFKDLYLDLVAKCSEIQKAKQENNQMQGWKNRLEQQPDNLQLKYEAATFYQQNQLMEQALVQLLAIVKANKSWEDKKANKAILQIFKKLGNASPLTQTYRKLFQRALN